MGISDFKKGYQPRQNTVKDEEGDCIRQILEKKWEYNEEAHHLFTDFKKTYDSVRMEVLYKILTEFGIPRKLVSLIFLNVMYKETKHVNEKQWNMNIILHQTQDSVLGSILNTHFDQHTNFQVNPSTVIWDIAKCFSSKMSLINIRT